MKYTFKQTVKTFFNFKTNTIFEHNTQIKILRIVMMQLIQRALIQFLLMQLTQLPELVFSSLFLLRELSCVKVLDGLALLL